MHTGPGGQSHKTCVRKPQFLKRKKGEPKRRVDRTKVLFLPLVNELADRERLTTRPSLLIEPHSTAAGYYFGTIIVYIYISFVTSGVDRPLSPAADEVGGRSLDNLQSLFSVADKRQ